MLGERVREKMLYFALAQQRNMLVGEFMEQQLQISESG